MRAQRSASGNRNSALLSGIVCIAIAFASGCASVPRESDYRPYDLLSSEHPVRISIDIDLLRGLESTHPGFLEALVTGADPDSVSGAPTRSDRGAMLSRFLKTAEYAYISLSIDPDTRKADFRVALEGGIPVSQIQLASLLSADLRQIRTDRLWYVDRSESIAITFPGQRLMALAPKPYPLGDDPLDPAGSGSVFSIAGSGAQLRIQVVDAEFIAGLIATQGLPKEIAGRIPVSEAMAELVPIDGENYSATVELATEKALQARLLGAAVVFAVQAAGIPGDVEVIDNHISVTGIVVTSEQIIDMILRSEKGGST